MNKPKQPKQQQWTEKNCTKYETKNAKKNRFLFKRNLHSGKKIKMKPNSIVVVVTMEKASSSSSSCMNHWLNMNRRLYVCGYIYRFVSFFLFFLNADFWKWDENWKVFFCTFWISNTHTHTPQFFHTLQANNPPETKN